MAIQVLPKLGTPNLFTPSLPVTEFGTPELYVLLKDMQDTMDAAKGIGIAAPQIGVNLRVFMLGFEKSERYPQMKPVPFQIFINPEIEIVDDEKIEMWEGCLSVPGLRGKVPRYKKLHYRAFDAEGHAFEGMASDFHARIIQHEYDHICGIVFPLRIEDMHCFGFEEVLMERAIAENSVVLDNEATRRGFSVSDLSNCD